MINDPLSKLTPKGRAIVQAVKDWHDALEKQAEADVAEEAAHERLSVFVEEYKQSKIAAQRNQLDLKLQEARRLLAEGKSADEVYMQLMQ